MSNEAPTTPKRIKIDQIVFNQAHINHYKKLSSFDFVTCVVFHMNRMRGGTVDPIHVVKRPDGKYFVIEGHLRVQAARLLWLDEIDAFVVDSSAEGTKEMLGLLLHEVKMPITKPVAKKGKPT